MYQNRREFIRISVVGISGLVINGPSFLSAAQSCSPPQHPIMPADMSFSGSCHNCGMARPMWARTWHTFKLNGQAKEVCSIHCLSEMSINAGAQPTEISVANYLEPKQMIPAEKAIYVVGSNGRGTMTTVSKLAFPSENSAQGFINTCGGEAASFSKSYALALSSIAGDYKMINKKRLKKGKIVEPIPGKDICPVCGMVVSKYPHNKCQIQTAKGETIHFCATQCLFEFLKNHDQYQYAELTPKIIWVIDFDSHEWIYGPNSFFVVGSSKSGPMGKEAFPFINRKKALVFAQKHGGTIESFKDITIDKIL